MLQKAMLTVIYAVLLVGLTGCASELPKPDIALASKIYDTNGNLITTLYEENRITVPLNHISKYVQLGTVAVEDVRFYQHYGLDPVGLGRAVVENIKAARIVEGGSTITQQTAKNLYLTHERTFSRKLKELYFTFMLERKYTKKEILEMYLNQIYYGYRAYGIEAAAQTYFAKAAKDLTLAESALLVGIPARPSSFSPFSNWEAAKKRQELVLDRMVSAGGITQEQAQDAKAEGLRLASSEKLKVEKAPYFIEEVRQYITEKYENGSELLLRGGLSIYTTLDMEAQKSAEDAIEAELKNSNTGLEGALVAINPKNGHVIAMVGGRDFTKSKFNRALAKRQPGSAFKPFLYAAAIEKGYTAASIIKCEPVTFGQGANQYNPQDYGDQPYHYRDFTLSEALMISDNVVSVKLNEQVGPKKLAIFAKRVGVDSKLRPYLSLALGTSEVSPLELTNAYVPFANQGQLAKHLMITKIVDKNEKVLEERTATTKQVIDPKTAYILTDMLSSVVKPGGTAPNVGRVIKGAVAGKTGTSQNYQDAWFVGYTPEVVAAVWVGYDQPKSVGRTGGGIAAPIWTNFVKQAQRQELPAEFPQPMGITRVKICADTGLLATPFSSKILEMAFVTGTEPKEECYVHNLPLFPSPEPYLEEGQNGPKSGTGKANDLGNKKWNGFGLNLPERLQEDAAKWGRKFWSDETPSRYSPQQQ